MDALTCTDEVLAQSASQGNREAFDSLVRRYQFKAVSVAQGVLGNLELAKDASQNAFAKAYFGLKGFRGDSKFKTWFYRILVNEAKDVLRKEKARGLFRFWKEAEDEEGETESILEAIPSGGRSPKEEVEVQETRARLEHAIRQIPNMEREVFILRYFQDLPLSEVAEVLGIAVGTVKAHLAHGSAKLKLMLKESAGQSQSK